MTHKKSVLEKAAEMSFGGLRRLVEDTKRRGVRIERKRPEFLDAANPGLSTSSFSPLNNTIYIPRVKDLPDGMEKDFVKKQTIGHTFGHEYGHAVHFDKIKKRLSNKRNLAKKMKTVKAMGVKKEVSQLFGSGRNAVKNKKEFFKTKANEKKHLTDKNIAAMTQGSPLGASAAEYAMSNMVKSERIANRNALANMQNKADREDYKKRMDGPKSGYATYKNTHKQYSKMNLDEAKAMTNPDRKKLSKKNQVLHDIKRQRIKKKLQKINKHITKKKPWAI